MSTPVLTFTKSVPPNGNLVAWLGGEKNLIWEALYSVKIKSQKRWGNVAHNKNLIMGEGGRIAAPVHKL